jgi:mannose-6-phosphate isomerase-like protein (cupin superfamily)
MTVDERWAYGERRPRAIVTAPTEEGLSYVSPSRGGSQLCAWQLTVPADLMGVAHRPSREEVLLVLEGELRITLDGTSAVLRAGDAVLVPAGTEFRVDAGPTGGRAWVTTTPGLEAVTADGAHIVPPWAQ